ncbi:MAG: CHAT domain-containing protein, partial [Anaerolineales bacterium]|nr:CHAT domain-containing protein [Anaerolineales bacterium]
MSSKHKTELIRQLVDQALHHQKTKNLVRTITYENFDIHITSAGQRGAYHITATYQQGAGDTAINQLDVDAPDFQEQLQFIEDFAAEKQDLKAFGKRLFDFVFTRGISHLYVRYREALLDSGKGLRLRLQIDPPELNVLPWEYLYDESSDTFIAKQTPTPIVRYIQQPYTPSFLSAAGKLKILIVIASPGNYPTLDIEFEKSKIVEALAYIQTKVEIKFLEHATSFTLFQEIQNFDPHAFHFIGHGRYKNGEGSLLLEGQDGQAIPLAADQLADLLYNRQTKIVILNACQTAAKSEHASAFNSVAQALVYKRIPAVFAMQFAVPDSLAVLFSQVLYEQLAIGKPLDQAVTEMRIAASVINGEEHGAWGIPVLYMRAPDGYLWQDEEK